MKTFPDVEAWLITYLGDIAPCYTVTPADLSTTVIQINRVGGSSDFLTDRPRVEISVYSPGSDLASARSEAWRVTELIRNRIDSAGGKVANGQLCDGGRVDNPPQQVPDPNTALRRVTTTYQLAFRRQ